MSPDPVILILEDERAQILTLRAQLHGLGKLVEFMDPEPALEYAGFNVCDAAIVDVGMAGSSMDGLAFLRALRQFDKDLAIIIRTGLDSEAIADGAIELRAIKRAVKSKTSLAEMRRSTLEAIRETRERRETMRRARDAEATKTKLSEALGTYDLRLAAAEVHRGLVHAMRSQLTGLSALASVLKEDATRSGSAAFAEHAGRSAELVGRMVDAVNAFLDGPYGENSTASHAAVNVCLEALRRYFLGVGRWAAEGKRLALRDLLSDTLVSCAPLELMNGLRHGVEYFFLQAPAGAEITLTASILQGTAALTDRLESAACVLNRGAVRKDGAYVLFRVAGPLPALAVDSARDAFSTAAEDGRTGNLHVLGDVLKAARGAVLLHRPASGLFLLDALFPVAL